MDASAQMDLQRRTPHFSYQTVMQASRSVSVRYVYAPQFCQALDVRIWETSSESEQLPPRICFNSSERPSQHEGFWFTPNRPFTQPGRQHSALTYFPSAGKWPSNRDLAYLSRIAILNKPPRAVLASGKESQ
jgi:hypothetical protein